MGLSPHMFDELVNNCLYFALGVIVVLIGSFFLFTGTYPRNAKPRKPSRQALGAGILLLGLAIAAPFASGTCLKKWSARSGMSSRRSRKGGMWI